MEENKVEKKRREEKGSERVKGGVRVFINKERWWRVWMGMGVVLHSLQKQT